MPSKSRRRAGGPAQQVVEQDRVVAAGSEQRVGAGAAVEEIEAAVAAAEQ